MSVSILLVDDDPTFLKLAEHLLSKRKWSVKSVGSAEAAIEFLKGNKPKLVITDIQLPGEDGLALTAYAVKSFPELPILVLTGKGNEKTAIQSFRLGAADYVCKESVQEELIGCIEKLIHEEERIEASIQKSSSPIRVMDATKNTSSKGTWREDLEGEYIIRQWGSNVISATAAKGPEREFCEQRLRVLRRQAERLDKWSALIDSCMNKRQSNRHPFADVVHLMPIGPSGLVEIENRFISFCRNISETGCSIIRNGLLREKNWAIFFPHRSPIDQKATCIMATLVRDKPIPLGMYEMGFTFGETVQLRPEDVVVMQSKKSSQKNSRSKLQTV